MPMPSAGSGRSAPVSEAADRDVGRLLADIFASHQVADLTLPLAEDLPCTWPGHMPFRATVWTWFGPRPADPQPVYPRTGGSYQTRWLVLDEHAGTHVDAPRHFIPPPGSGLPHAGPGGDVGVDRLPLLATAGPADVVDVTGLDLAPNGMSPPVTPAHLERWEAANGPIQAGDAVLLRSDWDGNYLPGGEGDAYGTDTLIHRSQPGWPAPTPQAMEWLHDRGVRCVGTDGLSIGPAEGGAPTHLAGLTRGMAFVEALAGLSQLPPRGAWFLFLPICLADGTGGPGRALAVLPAPARPAAST
ncbi:MAG: cyclase family protein [Actinobacteria bacterium]|nr:cyclase family protein [Actinomycetota bacterium]